METDGFIWTKTCSKCKQDLPATEFYVERAASTGLTSYCKKCTRQYQKARNQRIASEQAPTKRTRQNRQRELEALQRFLDTPGVQVPPSWFKNPWPPHTPTNEETE